MSRPSERVEFTSPTGHGLVGRLHRPVGRIRGVALFAHCFTCSKDLRATRGITEALAAKGVATLRFDFTGLGESGGALVDSSFSSNIGDLLAAAEWLAENVAPVGLLVGHSLGGAAALMAAARIHSCKAVATIGAPSDPAHVEHLLDAEQVRADGSAVVKLAGREFCIDKAFVDDLTGHGLLEGLSGLGRALLVLHSPQDTTVGIEHARKLFQAARHPKSFVSLDGADHLLSRPEDSVYAGEVIASWASRYAFEPVTPHRAVHRDDVEVYTGDSGFATEVVAHGLHRLRADEPVAVGGTDTGPSPFELVSAGLGACTSMTLRMYADRKKWPLTGVLVHVRHEASGPPGAGRTHRFTREIGIEGALDDSQRARLLEIANRCPVHRMLHGEIEVVTGLE